MRCVCDSTDSLSSNRTIIGSAPLGYTNFYMILAICITLSLITGCTLGILFARQKTLIFAERLRQREIDALRLEAEAVDIRHQRDEAIALRQTLETQLAAERATAYEKLHALTDAHTRLTAEFKALSADALKSNNAAFLELARESFGKLQQHSSGDLEKRQQAIDALVKPLKESLEKVDGKIAALEKSRAEAYGSLSEQLKSLSGAQLQLQSETARLSTALSSTSSAGTWGELQLRRVVELAGMTSYCDFSEQETSGALRADLVVRLPDGQRIVVDAKAPNEAYREAAVATEETMRAAKLLEHAMKVRAHVDALGAKNYWEQFQPSPEFVVLFLPGDQFLAAALQADPTLIERAIAKKVLIATPATLIALLKAASYGWRQEALSKNAEEISRFGSQLYDRLKTFADHLEKIGRSLETATKSFNAAIGSYETSVLPGARKFEELGAKGAKQIDPPTMIETGVRDLIRRA